MGHGKKAKKSSEEKTGKKRVAGGIGRLTLSEGEEDALLDLIAMLEEGQRGDRGLGMEAEPAEVGVGNSDSPSVGSGDDNDDNEAEEFTEIQTPNKVQSLITQLIRDERKASKEEVQNRSSEKSAIKQTLNVITPIVQNFDSDAFHSFNQRKQQLSPQLRLQVVCEGKSSSKLLLVERTIGLEDLLTAARNKFNAGKKFNSLFLAVEEELMLVSEMISTLPSESTLILSTRVMRAFSSVQKSTEVISILEDIKEVQIEEEKEINIPIIQPKKPALKSAWSIADLKPVVAEDTYTPSPRKDDPGESARLKRMWTETTTNNEEYLKLAGQREGLPIFEVKNELLSAIKTSQATVVSGETGSGKTTQLPSYILDEMIMNDHGSEAYIICTQPRRIAAITVAERVALERGEGVGNTVGYQVRLNSRLGDNTRIIYCTTGVLLRRLQQDGFLAGVSHILVDEVHERQTDTDFLMALLSRKLESYPHLRVILMSATLQETLFSDYFKCPIVYVRGRTFPVELHYLPEVLTLVAAGQNVVANERGKQHNAQMTPQKKAIQTFEMHIGRGSEVSKAKLPKFDPEIVAEVIIRLVQRYSEKTVVSTGVRSEATTGDAVLCFLSGIQAITNVERALRRRSLDSLNAVCYTLHGSLPSEYQKRVFRPTRPGEWKIILSTNIAETSVTVDDVTHVVDCGLHKEMRFDATANVSSLQEVPVSRAAARQRAGRAGRVRAGHCWRLYTETFFNGDVIEEYSVPEIRRVPLEEVVLQVLLLNLGLPEIFLGSCIEPPSREQVRRSVQTLLEIKAVLPLPSLPLTALGFHLAKLTVDVHLGKMLIVGALLNVLEPVLTIAAALGGRSPFLSPPNQRDQAAAAHRRFKVENFSDHLAIVSAYDAWCKVREGQGPTTAYAFCQTHYLAANTMTEISLLREHFRQYLRDAGFIAKLAGDGDAMEGRDEVVSGVEEKEKEQNGKLDDVMSDAISTNGEIISPISTRVTNDLVRCALTAGLFPQIVRACRYLEKAKVDAKGKGRQDMLPIHLLQADGKEVSLHPMSLCCRDLPSVFESRDGSRSREAYLVYYTKVASTKLFLHDCSSVPLPAILLFGGDLTISKSRDRVIVDTWIQLKSSELHAVLYKRLQREIEGLLISKVETPDADLADRQGILIAVLSKLLE